MLVSSDVLKAAEKTIENAQIDINSFLLEEIRLLKEDQKRIYDEILALKMDNLRMNSTLDNNKISTTKKFAKEETPKGMVLFDLLKTPAIVLTANDTFCEMLGYEINEVIGMPWHKFIHKDYVDSTLEILSKRNVQDPSVSFEQVYKHKDDGIFAAMDTHKIFFKKNGDPVSDLVTIDLTRSSTKFPSPHYQPLLQLQVPNQPNTFTPPNQTMMLESSLEQHQPLDLQHQPLEFDVNSLFW